MEETHPALTLVFALGAGVVAQSLARHARLPAIVLLLAAGAVLGPDVLGWIHPRDLGVGLFSIVELAVAVILFEGGLNLQLRRLRREQAAIQRLVTLGAVVTLALAAIVTHWILGWDWYLAVLFGSLVVVTGPTVIGPLVSELRLRSRVSTLLSAEGVLIDPVGAILAVLVLEIVVAPDAPGASARDLALRAGFGAVMGIAAGFALGGLLRLRKLVPEGFENIFVLASVLVLAEGCNTVVSQSGILAVTIAGVVVGNMDTPVHRDLREFKDQLTILLIGLLFVLLSADVRFEHLSTLGWPALAVVAALVFVVRPVTVWLCTMGTGIPWQERAFVAWIAPRGIVAAAIASLVGASLEEAGIEGGTQLRALVFLTIIGTVLQAGLSAGVVGNLLGVRLPGRDSVAIMGANGLALLLAEELRRAGTPVTFLDSNPQNCRRAEEAGFSVVWANAVEERSMQRARFPSVKAAIAMTPNQTVNGVFVSRARERFHVPRGYVSAEQTEAGLVRELVEHGNTRVLFEAHHDIERWDVRSRHDGIDVVQARFTPPPAPETTEEGDAAPAPPPRRAGERFAIFALRRGDSVEPMSRSWTPKEGDIGTIALHRPERDEALEVLCQLGWTPIEESSEDAVDEERVAAATISAPEVTGELA